MADGQAFNYRALYRRLRPARVATFLSASSPRWEHDALRMLENYSLTWGGSLDVLAPFRTDGSVHPVLWRLVELFDADHVATYTETRRGLRLADPAEFERWLDREVTAWIERYGGDRVEVERLLQRDNLLDHAEPWDPPEALTNRLVRRTAPIIERDKLRWTRFRPDASTAHGLVDVLHLNDLPDRIVNVSTDALPMWARLVVAARFGHLGSRQAEGLLGRGVAIEQIDASPSDLDLLLRWAWFGNQDWLLAVVGRMTGTTAGDRGFSPVSISEIPQVIAWVGCG